MLKKVIVVLIFLLLVSTVFANDALKKEKRYKGEDQLLLKKGDRLLIDDLKIKVRSVDHFRKTAKFYFIVNGLKVDEATLGLYQTYNFQGKVKIKPIDIYRKLWYKNKRVKFVRIEIRTYSSGKISEVELSRRYGKSPYVLIENTGLSLDAFDVSATTKRKSYLITPERRSVIVEPFTSKKVGLIIKRNAVLLDDYAIIILEKDGKVIDRVKVSI